MKRQRDCARLRGSGWHHRPRLLLPVLAPPASGGSHEAPARPAAWPASLLAGTGRCMTVLAGVRRLRRARSGGGTGTAARAVITGASGNRPGRHARAAASPDTCASRPAGAAAARGPGRRKTRPASAPGAASSAATAGRACATGAGRKTRSGRSSRPAAWPPGLMTRRPGLATSPAAPPPGSPLPGRRA